MGTTKKFMTPAEVAEELNKTVKTLQNWRYMDEPYGPPHVKVGGQVMYPTSKFNEWCDKLADESLKNISY